MPERIGQYEIKNQIGRGGMGTVYHAFDPGTKRNVALKMISARFTDYDKAQSRFTRETEIFANLEHPAIVPVYNVGNHKNQLFIVMRLMTGGTLSERLQKGALTAIEANNIIKRISSALAMTHEKGIIHRDLKPDNILFDQQDKAYITDFGIAKIVDSTSDLTGETNVGTYAYMSPEQFDNKRTVDNRADIYSLGIILFEMLTGQRPFQAETPPEWINAHFNEPVPFIHNIRTGLPLGSEIIVQKAMAKAPEDRFDSVAQMAEALEKLIEEDTGKHQSYELLASIKTANTAETITAPELEKPPLTGRPILKWLPWIFMGVIVIALLSILILNGLSDIFPTPILTLTPSPSATLSPSPTETQAVPTIVNTPLPPIEGSLVVVFYDSASAIVQIGDRDIQRLPESGQVPLPTSGESVVLQSNAGSMELLLSDKTRLFLDLNTSIRVERVSGMNEAENTLISLEEGLIAVSNATEKVLVGGPFGVTVAMDVGMVEVSQDHKRLDIDCINGSCTLSMEDGTELELQTGESTFIDDSGTVADIRGARYALFGDLTNPLSVTPTFTPSPSSTMMATQTPTPTRAWPIIQVIGQSVNDQRIEAVQFGDGPNIIIFVGGLHAGFAPSTVTLAEESIRHFTEYPEEIPDSITLYIIPSVNPDSPAAIGEKEGRYNANGVDPNRNWDCRHVQDPIISSTVEPGRGGLTPFSEPEVVALRDFILSSDPMAIVFWVARARNGIVSPGACAEESQVSNELAQIYGSAASYEFVANFESMTGIELNGDAMNWLDQQGIPAIGVLLRDYIEIDFQRNLDGMRAVLNQYSPVTPQPFVPDEIVFQSNRDGDFEIYIMSIDGSNQRQLTFNDAADNFPRVSPDGKKIVFESEHDGNPEIYVMERDGSKQQRLTFDPADDGLPAWSPDGQQIAFYSDRADSENEIFIMSAQGDKVQRITFTEAAEGHSSWSFTDQLIFNVTEPDQAYWQIYAIGVDGSNLRPLTNSQVDEWSPEWSPDGQQILFLSERDSSGNAGIYVMNADGSDARLVYNDPLFEWGPVWSANGEQILFTVDQPDDTADIFIMNADGSDVRQLVERGGYPSWAAAIGRSARILPDPPIISDEVVAFQVLSSPIIDGSLTEWENIPAYVLTHRVHNSAGWDGTEDLTAVCQLSWDSNNLYVSVAVTDDRHTQTQVGAQIYRGDSVEIQLDTDLQGDIDDSLSSDDFQIALSPGNFANLPPSAVVVRGGSLQQSPDGTIRLASAQTTSGYEMEVVIPWQVLNVTSSPNLVMRLALNANDNDTLRSAVQEVMMSNAPNRTLTDPTSWGTLTLDPVLAFTRLLHLTEPNLRGEDVRVIQQRLFDLGYTQVGEIDGIFGPMTGDAVKAFQEDNGLEVSGAIEPATWAAILGTND